MTLFTLFASIFLCATSCKKKFINFFFSFVGLYICSILLILLLLLILCSTSVVFIFAGKAVVNMPAVGGPAVMNNYMIAQPPGFQLAAFVNIFPVQFGSIQIQI